MQKVTLVILFILYGIKELVSLPVSPLYGQIVTAEEHAFGCFPLSVT